MVISSPCLIDIKRWTIVQSKRYCSSRKHLLNETEPVIQDVTPTEVIQDQESSEKGSAEVSTAGAKKGTASEEVPIVSIAEGLGLARDEEIARQWDEEERQRAMAEAKSTKKIDWNDPSVIRQPIDKKTTSTLTHFMGSLARSGKYCPLYKPWPKVGSSKKQTLLDVLNDKFDLPMGCDDWFLKSFGKKVRNWRARVKKDYYDPSLSYREQINSKPTRVRPVHWKKLVKTWNKENSKIAIDPYIFVTIVGGREPTRRELFRDCFSTDGIAKNAEAANAIYDDDVEPESGEGLVASGQSSDRDNSKEWNSGDDQLRFRWMIYFVVLADAAESVSDAIRFEYCLASSSGWTKSPVLWAEIGESSLIGPELVQETTDKVGDRVLLKVSPWKGVIRFGKRGMLVPRYVRPFEILERIGPVAYRLRLPEELSSVHDTFYVSNLKKCLANASLHVPLNEIKVDKTLRFVEEPVEIMDREIKKLKRSKIALVKVHWNSKRGSEFTWEREDHMKSKYPQLFMDHDVESASVWASHFEYVVLDNEYSICSLLVIMEGNDVLHDKFDLPMGCDDWILKSFGKKESLGGREPTRRELFCACFSTDGIAKNEEDANEILTHLVSSIYDKMEELSSQLPEGATDEPRPQDVYSKVMGKENNRPTYLYGLGARASDVWGVVPSHAARLNEPQPLRVGAEVYIKSIFNSTKIVAKGRIQSLDPNEIVRGEELGPNWCEVSVQVFIKRDEHLVR
ncbi:putative reverse transcriptase domain-containing protein [Tanacetum coccineum]